MGITVSGIQKSFGNFPALHGIDLEARPGEFLALLGPSGSGKTTLLRIIAGLEFPDVGRVYFDGVDVTEQAITDRRVGFVFQQYALFKHMTVADNVAFGLTVRKRSTRPPKAEINRRVAELLDLVQLGNLGKRYPAQLSGGQRQRVALARALAVEPRMLLLDVRTELHRIAGRARDVLRAQDADEIAVLDDHEASLLEVEPGAPSLLMTYVNYLQDWTPLEFRRTYVRGDRCKYYVDQDRPEPMH